MARGQETYLITGAAGQLGCGLQEVWEGTGKAIPRAKEAFDITNSEHVEKRLTALRPDVVINCASYTNVQGAEADRLLCWQVNTEAVQRLAQVCSKHDIALVHISTDFVFGQDHTRVECLKNYDPSHPDACSQAEKIRQACYKETDPVGPLGFYGQTKAAAEHAILREAIENPDFQYYIVRTAGLFEKPWRSARNFPLAIAGRLRNSKVSELPVVSDVITNITYVPHLAQAIRWIVENRNDITVQGVTIPVGIYHITNQGMVSWYRVAEELDRSFGFSAKLKQTSRVAYCKTAGLRPELNPSFTAMCSSKYEGTLGPPMPSWGEAITDWAAQAVEYLQGQ